MPRPESLARGPMAGRGRVSEFPAFVDLARPVAVRRPTRHHRRMPRSRGDRPASATRVHHVALRVADPEQSVLFYGDLLGLREVRRFEEGGRVRSIWLDAGNAVLMLERAIKGGPSAGSGRPRTPARSHRMPNDTARPSATPSTT